MVNYLKLSFRNLNIYNEKYFINSIINYSSYKDYYFNLHKELSIFYGDETEEIFNNKFLIIKDFIEKEQFTKKKELINDFQIFAELKNKNYEKIIRYYLNNDNFSQFLYFLLNKKEIDIYKKIGFFAGNLIHCIVEYGKKEKKGVNTPKIFYSGMQLNIIEVLEFLKNKKNIITFPYFLSMTTKKELVEISSNRNISVKEREAKNLFSVIIKIDYSYDKEYEPSCFDLEDLSQNQEEKEYLILPFTFYKLDKIIIDCENYIADIELKIIGKKEILENKIKISQELVYDHNLNIMKIK